MALTSIETFVAKYVVCGGSILQYIFAIRQIRTQYRSASAVEAFVVAISGFATQLKPSSIGIAASTLHTRHCINRDEPGCKSFCKVNPCIRQSNAVQLAMDLGGSCNNTTHHYHHQTERTRNFRCKHITNRLPLLQHII